MAKETESPIQNHQEIHLWIAYVAKKPKKTPSVTHVIPAWMRSILWPSPLLTNKHFRKPVLG